MNERTDECAQCQDRVRVTSRPIANVDLIKNIANCGLFPFLRLFHSKERRNYMAEMKRVRNRALLQMDQNHTFEVETNEERERERGRKGINEWLLDLRENTNHSFNFSLQIKCLIESNEKEVIKNRY